MKLKTTFLSVFVFAFALHSMSSIDFNYPFQSNSKELIRRSKESKSPLPVNFLGTFNQKASHISRRNTEELPTESKIYEWYSNNWAFEFDKRYEYSPDGKLLKETLLDLSGPSEIILRQGVFTYNNFGAITSETVYTRQNSVLKPLQKDSFAYTQFGNLILEENYTYNTVNSEWKRQNGWKYEVVYEGGNLKSKTYYEFFNTYEMTAKDDYTYDGLKVLSHVRTTYHGVQIDKQARWNYSYVGNVLKDVISQEMSGGYHNKVRITIDSMLDYSIDKLDEILVWNSLSLVYDTKMTGYLEELSLGATNWVNDKKYELEWVNNNYKNLFYYWNSPTQSWVNDYEIARTITGNTSVTLSRAPYQGIWYDDYRETTVIGTKGETIEYKQEFYYEDWDEWDIINWFKFVKTYDGNNKILEIIELELDGFNQVLVNHSKEVFAKWQTVNVSSQVPSIHKTFTVYPNPASSYIMVNSKGFDKYNMQIRNMNGIVVYSVENQIENTRINLLDLGISSGLYLISIENLTGNEIELFKLLIE